MRVSARFHRAFNADLQVCQTGVRRAGAFFPNAQRAFLNARLDAFPVYSAVRDGRTVPEVPDIIRDGLNASMQLGARAS